MPPVPDDEAPEVCLRRLLKAHIRKRARLQELWDAYIVAKWTPDSTPGSALTAVLSAASRMDRYTYRKTGSGVYLRTPAPGSMLLHVEVPGYGVFYDTGPITTAKAGIAVQMPLPTATPGIPISLLNVSLAYFRYFNVDTCP